MPAAMPALPAPGAPLRGVPLAARCRPTPHASSAARPLAELLLPRGETVPLLLGPPLGAALLEAAAIVWPHHPSLLPSPRAPSSGAGSPRAAPRPLQHAFGLPRRRSPGKPVPVQGAALRPLFASWPSQSLPRVPPALHAFAGSPLPLTRLRQHAVVVPPQLAEPRPLRPREVCAALPAFCAGSPLFRPPKLAALRAAGEGPPAAALPISVALRRSAAPPPSSSPVPLPSRPPLLAAPHADAVVQRAASQPLPRGAGSLAPLPASDAASLVLLAAPTPDVPPPAPLTPRAAVVAPPEHAATRALNLLCVAAPPPSALLTVLASPLPFAATLPSASLTPPVSVLLLPPERPVAAGAPPAAVPAAPSPG
mmetsp:Transcript_73542/g.172508  ORF Transcript_73542/g.172508 Transcript_73542/m.172508 type:complete len:367 (-) Transcript_73542:521-1621(-)